MSSHIPASQLALYSTGDLGFWTRRKMERHLAECEECSRLATRFATDREDLSETKFALPGGLSEARWAKLSREMTANIRLGLEAGECVGLSRAQVGRPRLTLALAGLAVLIVIAGLERPVIRPSGVPDNLDLRTLESSQSGIEVRASGRVLAVPAPTGRDVIQTVDTRGEMRSRYVDDSGVTIINVYAE